MFDQYKEGIRKRRQERLQILRKKQKQEGISNFPSSTKNVKDWDYSSFSNSQPEEREDHQGMLPFIVKVLCSFILVAGVYYIMNTQQSQWPEAKNFIEDVFQKDFNVTGVMAWYEEKTDQTLTFLPKLVRRDEASTEKKEEYVVPVSGGKVVTNFGSSHQGIMVGTASRLPIEVVKEGWVTFVGHKEGLGYTVIIDHGNGEESWYGQLQNLKVEEYDWVEQGNIIGYTSIHTNSGQGMFYFALKRDSVFIDPLDVISFD